MVTDAAGSTNVYTYAGNSPTNFTDPLGLKFSGFDIDPSSVDIVSAGGIGKFRGRGAGGAGAGGRPLLDNGEVASDVGGIGLGVASGFVVGVGGSLTAGTGVDASAGVLINPGSGYPFFTGADIGLFGSIGATTGVNVSGDFFVGYVSGASSTMNQNLIAGPLSVTILFDTDTGQFAGLTVGYGSGSPPIGASGGIFANGNASLGQPFGLP